jgi:chromosome partitioning protein
VFNTTIPRNIKLSEAPSFGKPVLLYDVDSVGARSYLQLAEEMLGKHATRLATALAAGDPVAPLTASSHS